MASEKVSTFEKLALDERLAKAISCLGWCTPTLVQSAFIPLALEGRDIVTKARTGSGKTGAFLIPILHQILQAKASGSKPCIQAVLLAPTKELCAQIASHSDALCRFCSRDIKVLNLSLHADTNTEKLLLKSLPDVVVCTPGRLVAHCADAAASLLADVRFVVVDEADLLYSFGYQADVISIVKNLPAGKYQTLLTSATMSDDVEQLKKDLRIKRAANVKLEEGQLPSAAQLTQYHVSLNEEDKFVLLYALLKLKLISGKSIIFVKDTDRCYQLRLFLGQFGIASCVLNAEMPVKSRLHIVAQFNSGVYDLVIASDDTTLVESRAPEQPDSEASGSQEPEESKDEQEAKKPRRTKHRKRDKESGVARGVDFNCVANVINFDFPISVDDYVHRVGRPPEVVDYKVFASRPPDGCLTARGTNKGCALSFHTRQDTHVLQQVQEVLTRQLDCGDALRPYEFNMEELDGFRYRARDVLRSVTSTAVREARLSEIRNELLKSKKLDTYFAKNPHELESLRHDSTRHTIKRQPHLGAVPEYIVPAALRGAVILDDGATSKSSRSNKRKRQANSSSAAKHKFMAKKKDPLSNFDCLDDDDF